MRLLGTRRAVRRTNMCTIGTGMGRSACSYCHCGCGRGQRDDAWPLVIRPALRTPIWWPCSMPSTPAIVTIDRPARMFSDSTPKLVKLLVDGNNRPAAATGPHLRPSRPGRPSFAYQQAPQYWRLSISSIRTWPHQPPTPTVRLTAMSPITCSEIAQSTVMRLVEKRHADHLQIGSYLLL